MSERPNSHPDEIGAQACGVREGDMARILLVEDNEQIWDFLSRRLQRRGHEVMLAHDGEEGVASARAGSPDVVLLNMNLPVLDGWTAARVLKGDPQTQNIPIIALTAHPTADDGEKAIQEKAIQAGADVCHPKPIDSTRLFEQIEELIAARSTE
jgi:two-component system, cell cycle response regulator DivK